jgi:hypothetical protein
MRLWKQKGKQYWILPTSGQQLIIVNNDWIKLYNQKVEKAKRLDYYSLNKMAYFATPCGKLSERKQPKK